MDATILVNRTHRLPRKAIPQTLVEPEIIFDAPVGDRKRLLAVSAAKGVEALFARGKEEGIYLCGVSGYRSYERQEELYQKKRREQPKETGDHVHWIAPPGASEHQTGLALDVSCQAVDYQLDERFGETREGPVAETVCTLIWLHPALSERERAYNRIWMGALAYPVCNPVAGVVSDTYRADTGRIL